MTRAEASRWVRFGVVLVTVAWIGHGLGAPVPAAAGLAGTSVSKTSGLDPAGDRITVSGTGFDQTKGIYVAVCVDRGPGVAPSPCLGGAATGGSAGSAWISSNPPAYGKGLATPYGPGGSFSVTLSVVARDPVTGTDCTVVRCAAVTRADHTRPDDRSQDTRVPLRFAPPSPARSPAQLPAQLPARSPAPKPTAAVPPVTSAPAAPSAPAGPTSAPAGTAGTTTSAPATTSALPAVGNTAGTASEPRRDGSPWWFVLGALVLLAAAIGGPPAYRRRRGRVPTS